MSVIAHRLCGRRRASPSLAASWLTTPHRLQADPEGAAGIERFAGTMSDGAMNFTPVQSFPNSSCVQYLVANSGNESRSCRHMVA